MGQDGPVSSDTRSVQDSTVGRFTGGRPADPELATVLDLLSAEDFRILQLFSPDGAPLDPRLWAEAADAVRTLMDIDVTDPAGLVSYRVQLVETCAGGLRLSRLGRAAAAHVRNR